MEKDNKAGGGGKHISTCIYFSGRESETSNKFELNREKKKTGEKVTKEKSKKICRER